MGQLVYLKNVVTLTLNEEKCAGCGTCEVVCPHKVFHLNNGKVASVDRDACMDCGACATNCPTAAITVQSGVGCAAAVINAALGRRSSSCSCVIEPKKPGDPQTTLQNPKSVCC